MITENSKVYELHQRTFKSEGDVQPDPTKVRLFLNELILQVDNEFVEYMNSKESVDYQKLPVGNIIQRFNDEATHLVRDDHIVLHKKASVSVPELKKAFIKIRYSNLYNMELKSLNELFDKLFDLKIQLYNDSINQIKQNLKDYKYQAVSDIFVDEYGNLRGFMDYELDNDEYKIRLIQETSIGVFAKEVS